MREKQTPLQGLFIGSCWGINGSERSLSTLLKHYLHVEQSLLLPYPIFEKCRVNLKEFYPYARILKPKILPKDNNYLGAPNHWKSDVKQLIRNWAWRSVRRSFYKWLEEQNFDFIHLNSYIFNPLIVEEFPFFLHMREVVPSMNAITIKRIEQARGVVCIDQLTNKAVDFLPDDRKIILNNPFDMEAVKHVKGSQILKALSIDTQGPIFSIIGSIIPVKGVREVVKSFCSSKSKGILLVVGDGDDEYKNECRNIAKNDSRILFTGIINDIEKIYAVSHYIVRGDPHHAIGRTIFEGLYSGCRIITPGRQSDIDSNPALKPFSDVIRTYLPQNWKELSSLFDLETNHVKFIPQSSSNCEAYVTDFHKFVLKNLR